MAKACGIQEELGKKGKGGVLKAMTRRAAFLAQKAHRIRFFSLPKPASWLNPIELWFSMVVRRFLKRLSVG